MSEDIKMPRWYQCQNCDFSTSLWSMANVHMAEYKDHLIYSMDPPTVAETQHQLNDLRDAVDKQKHLDATAAAAQRRALATVGRVTFRPTPGRVVVKVLGDNTKIAGGLLFAPDTARMPRTTGRVIATYEPYVENGVEFEPFVNPGDIVLFGEFTGTKVSMHDIRDTIIVLKEDNILSIIEVEGDEDARAELIQRMETEV